MCALKSASSICRVATGARRATMSKSRSMSPRYACSLKNGGSLCSLWTSLSCSCVFPVPVVVAPTVSAAVGPLSVPVVCCADADAGSPDMSQ